MYSRVRISKQISDMPSRFGWKGNVRSFKKVCMLYYILIMIYIMPIVAFVFNLSNILVSM
jgi:hypothetical protein